MLDFFILIFTLLFVLKMTWAPRCHDATSTEFSKHFTNDTFLHSQIFFLQILFEHFNILHLYQILAIASTKKNLAMLTQFFLETHSPNLYFPVTFHFDTFSVFFFVFLGILSAFFLLIFFKFFFPNLFSECKLHLDMHWISNEFPNFFNSTKNFPKTNRLGNRANSDALFLLSQKGCAYFYHRHKYK